MLKKMNSIAIRKTPTARGVPGVMFIASEDKESVRDRIMERCKTSATGCWNWSGPLTSDSSTGSLRIGTMVLHASNASYMAFLGPIPEGKTATQCCGNSLCCRPEHLELTDRAYHTGSQRAHTYHSLSKEDRLAIKKDARSLQEIAEERGLSVAHIGLIKSRRKSG